MRKLAPPILILCPECGGDGMVELPDNLLRTLKAVRAGRTTADKVLAADGDTVSVNAISNRLLALHKLGLLKRHREGKFWHYAPVKK